MFRIVFQKNPRPREYVYELSVQYLVARCLHLAINLQLAQRIPKAGLPFSALAKRYPGYEPLALKDLIGVLSRRGIFRIQDEIIFPTRLSETLIDPAVISQLSVSELAWRKSYDIMPYLMANPEIVWIFLNPAIWITLDAPTHTLTLASADPLALLQCLSHSHVLSRVLRFLAENRCFDGAVSANVQAHCGSLSPDVLALLRRYHLLVPHSDRLSAYGATLRQDAPDTIQPALCMIDRAWWQAAECLSTSFKRDTPCAFECANGQSFYTHVNQNDCFRRGMAAISYYEDKEVAAAIMDQGWLDGKNAIVDIGGGEAGLLYALYQHHQGAKHSCLFEANSTETQQQQLKEQIVCSYGAKFLEHLEIQWGNFLAHAEEDAGIPKKSNTLYLIKCCLHNHQQADVIRILQNIRTAMGTGSNLVLAERVLPQAHPFPHYNELGNILMRLLFKAEAHDEAFYVSTLEQAELICGNEMTYCGRYLVLLAKAVTCSQQARSASTSPALFQSKSNGAETIFVEGKETPLPFITPTTA